MISALVLDAQDPDRLARFWGEMLGQAPVGTVLPSGDVLSFPIRFAANDELRSGRLQMHFDLTSGSPADQQEMVAHALALGASHLDVGQRDGEGHVVLADPEGNEFCVIEPDNDFLAGCGVVGALAGDGSRATGCFWSEVLEWPLVWDEGEETGIQSPRGGTKISWGGPPLLPRTGKYRPHLDLVAGTDSDLPTEVARLVALGARFVDIGQGDVDWAVLADPDGHEFCVVPGSGDSALPERCDGPVRPGVS